ncbi:MAG: polymer-forming cytoskeletal protein [Flavobacteriaceae bacterium]
MFSDKKNKSATATPSGERNIIAKNTTFIGEIISDGDFRVDGTIEGSIKTSGRIIIGKEGKIVGKTFCNNADVEGSIQGELTVEELLTLKESANIQGDVSMEKLSVAPGAIFNVNCTMKGGVKSLNDGKGKSEKTA